MGLRDYFGRNELAAVAVFVGVVVLANLLVLGNAMGWILPGSYYDRVAVSYERSSEGLHVEETFDVVVSGSAGYKVLFRSFDEEICFTNCELLLEGMECSMGSPYYYDGNNPYNPNTQVREDPAFMYLSRMEPNEVGCFGEGFPGSRVSFTVDYLVPAERLDKIFHRHYFFTNDHFRIKRLEVDGVTGKSSASYLLENSPLVIDADSGEVLEKTTFWPYMLLSLLLICLPLVVFYFLGRDKDYTVPEYLHTIPNKKREAWEVDLIVRGSSKMGPNGLGSILLSLYMKKVATFEQRGALNKKIHVKYNRDHGKKLTVKEQQVVDLILSSNYESGEYVFSPSSKVSEIRKILGDGMVRDVHKQVLDSAGYKLLLIGSMVLLFVTYYFARESGFLLMLLMANGVAILAMTVITPPSVFSRFKGDYRKEYLEWLSFKSMLTDYARIQQYLKEDYRQWKEWLVYATALGAAEKLLKAMKELNVITSAEYDNMYRTHTYAMVFATSSHSAGSQRSGGGGFGGGGFGGGGGGGR